MKTKLFWLVLIAVAICSNSLLAQNFVWTQSGAPTEPWQCVASSSDGTKLVAGINGGGIYTSIDSGTNWTLTSAPSASWLSIASSSDGTKLVAVIEGGGIYSSTNSGANWTLTSALSKDWFTVASSSDGTKLVAVIRGGGIYTSTNSGANWTYTSAPSETWFSVASSSDGTKLVGVGYPGGIYTSTNSGTTWTLTSARIPNYFSVASSSDGTKLVVVAYPGGIYTSTNSGANWTLTSAPNGNVNWYSVASSSDGTTLVAGIDGGGIYTSINSGANWTLTSAPSANWLSIASSSDGTKLVAAANSGGIYTGCMMPSITQQPSSLASCPGSSPILGVAVTGTPPFSYQWRKDGTNLVDGGNIIGSTTTNLTLLDVSQSDSANYDVVITNVAGCVTSSVATLFVTSTPAQATPIIVNGFIVGAILTDGGCGYTNQAAVYFSGQGGNGAAGYVQISSDGTATNIVITSAGFGYPLNTVAQVAPPFFPTVGIVLANTPAAAATPIITNGFIVGANLTASGSDYAIAPPVSFSDVSGSGAAAYAQISNGSVTSIFITDAGSGYSSNTVINIPPAGYLNSVIPSANALMLGQSYQLQISSGLNNWTDFGAPFFATNNAWSPADYWIIANTNQMFFRLQMLP